MLKFGVLLFFMKDLDFYFVLPKTSFDEMESQL